MAGWQIKTKNLESAVLAGNLEEIRRISSNQNIKSAEYYNILKRAISSGQTEVAKLLINSGCQLHFDENTDHSSDLDMDASSDSSPDSSSDSSSDLDLDSSFDSSLDSSSDSSSDITSKSSPNNEILHVAIEAGNLELVKLLIQTNISTQQPDANGIPPIFKIVNLSIDNLEYSKFLKCFLSNRAHISDKWKQNGFTILHYAAEKGNAKIIPLLIKKKCPINDKALDGSTALHIATKKGFTEVVVALLNSGAKDMILDKDKLTALCLAIKANNFDAFNLLLKNTFGSKIRKTQMMKRSDNELLVCLAVSVKNMDMIRLLLSSGATVNSYSEETGQSAVHMAVEAKNVQILILLLKHKPNLDKINREGFTPLHLACVKGIISIVSALLNTNKCDLNVKSATDLTALHLAMREGHSKVVSLLLKKGADYKVVDLDNKTPLTFVLENTQGSTKCLEIFLTHIHQVKNVKCSDSSLSSEDNILIKYHSRSKKDKTGNSVLHVAVQDEDISTIKLLLSHRAGINILNKNGHTPFDLATVNGSLSIVDIFLQSQKNKDSFFIPKIDNGYTPVHLAVESENTDMLKLFFKSGISADISKPNSLTPLHIAVQKNNKNLIMLLLKNGAKVDVPGRSTLETPLFIAAESGNAEVLELLSEASTTRSSEWTEGYLLMCISAYYGHEKIVKYLLDKQVDPNANVDKYLTPLHAAAQRGHENIVHLLLEHGAKINPKPKIIFKNNPDFFSTPLLAASHGRHSGIVNLLIEHGADLNQHLFGFDQQFAWEPEKILTSGSYQHWEIVGIKRSLIGYTALHFAVEARDKSIVKSLIIRGAVLNIASLCGVTAIGLAIENEDESIIKLLISAGVDVSYLHRGHSVLKIESLKKNVKIAEMIVNYMCSSQRYESYTNRYSIPLEIAVENNLEECVKVLLKSQAVTDLNHSKIPFLNIAINTGNLAIFEMLLKHGIDVNYSPAKFCTALMHAVRSGNENIVRRLLDAGADTKITEHDDISVDNNKYKKPLHVAIENKKHTIVEIFLKKEDLNTYSEDESPFCLALQKSSPQVVQIFLNYGASIRKKDKDGIPPLFNAVKGSNLDVINFLLKKGASLKARDNQRNSVLHFALRSLKHIKHGPSEAIIELLLEYGANVNMRDKNGYMPLNLLINRRFDAATIGIRRIKSNLVKLFLSNSANPNQLDKHSGSTILDHAIQRCDPAFVQLLLLNGSEIDILNKNNETPLNSAIANAIEFSNKYRVNERLKKELDHKEHDEDYGAEVSNSRKIVRLVTKEVARRQAVTNNIDELNRISVESEYVKNYYDRCQKEIELMKMTEICQRITFFDLLAANYSRLTSLAKNTEVQNVLLLTRQVSNLFPEYIDVLNDRIKTGIDRRILLNSSHQYLKKVLRYEFSLENVEHILSFLANRDLKNLKNCFDKNMYIK